MVIGGHGDTTMIPLINHATWNSIPVTQFLSKEQQEKVVASTMVGGATLTKLIGTSAWYAPGAGTAAMVESIVRDQKKLISSGVFLEGEYGQKDISLVVPVILGKNGAEKILDIKLSDTEQATFNKSADAVRNMNDVLYEMKLV
jgi:malate dehydrogenase